MRSGLPTAESAFSFDVCPRVITQRFQARDFQEKKRNTVVYSTL
jgi:hypothetical protein